MEMRRYGSPEVHLQWEQQDAVMPMLERVVNNVCGDMGLKSLYQDNMLKRDFVNMLLRDKEFVEALGEAKNKMEAENKDTGPYDLPEIYKLIGKGR